MKFEIKITAGRDYAKEGWKIEILDKIYRFDNEHDFKKTIGLLKYIIGQMGYSYRISQVS